MCMVMNSSWDCVNNRMKARQVNAKSEQCRWFSVRMSDRQGDGVGERVCREGRQEEYSSFFMLRSVARIINILSKIRLGGVGAKQSF